MSGRGAPLGNGNAASGREFREALRYVLASYVSGDVKRGQALKAIAKKQVELALAGDMAAIKEIADRLDGKPSQTITGAEGRPLIDHDAELASARAKLFAALTKGMPEETEQRPS